MPTEAEAAAAPGKFSPVPTLSLPTQGFGVRVPSTQTTATAVTADGETTATTITADGEKGDCLLTQGDGLVEGSDGGSGGDGDGDDDRDRDGDGNGENAAVAKVRLAARACAVGVKRGLRLAASKSLPAVAAATAAAKRPQDEGQGDTGAGDEENQKEMQVGSIGEKEGQEPGTRAVVATDGLVVRRWRGRARVAEDRLQASEVGLYLGACVSLPCGVKPSIQQSS